MFAQQKRAPCSRGGAGSGPSPGFSWPLPSHTGLLFPYFGSPIGSPHCAYPIPECYTGDSVPALRVCDLSFNSPHSRLASNSSLFPYRPHLPQPPRPPAFPLHSPPRNPTGFFSLSPNLSSPTHSLPFSPLEPWPWPRSLGAGTPIQLINSPSRPPLQPRASQLMPKGAW